MDESNTRRIVILGKTGAGKSSLANTIFGEKLFETNFTLNSETRECQAQTRSVNGRRITLIDTPGFFDTDRPEEDMKAAILRCITECAPGPHAFLIVLKVEKFTEHEKAVIEKIRHYFSDEALKYAVVVFTHGDQLLEGMKIKEFVNQNKAMKDLVKKCGNRCHVFDNRYWKENLNDKYRSNQFQVEELLKTIDKMILANKGSCYTNEMLQAVQEEIRREEKMIRKSSGNMSEEAIRKRAKHSAFEKFWIRAAGVTTGALIGALCGVAVMVGLVYTVLKISAEAEHLKQAIKITVGAAGGAAGEAAAGGAAAGGAGTAGTALRVTTGVVAAVGAVAGGFRGYRAAEEADTPWEAVKMAAGAVKDDAMSFYDNTTGFLKKVL